MTPEQFTRRITGRFGTGAISGISGVTVTVDVPPRRWLDALLLARDELRCDCFDWLSAVDELADGFAIVAHVYSSAGSPHLLLRTRVRAGAAHLPSATSVYGGAARSERETADRFGVVFEGHPGPAPLLLPGGFEGNSPGVPC
jgi:NADH-quinone oxidoreductase subunit C